MQLLMPCLTGIGDSRPCTKYLYYLAFDTPPPPFFIHYILIQYLNITRISLVLLITIFRSPQYGVCKSSRVVQTRRERATFNLLRICERAFFLLPLTRCSVSAEQLSVTQPL